jgi:hypothetical protein
MENPRTNDREALELEEKHVADEINKAIPQPTSIEAEALLEAAEIEEATFGRHQD